MVSGTRCPYVSVCGCEVVRGAAAPKEPMTYAVGPLGWNLGLKARIWASRVEFGSLGLDIGLTARIWASGLEFWPQSWDLGS